MRRLLPATLALHALLILACMPPTTYGLRSAGDVAEPGTGGVAGAVGATTSGLLLGTVEGDIGLTERLGAAAAVGAVTGGGQAQAELRWSTRPSDGWGVGGMIGGSAVYTAGFVPYGPHLAVIGRRHLSDQLVGYGGLKANLVFDGATGGALATTWLQPTAGAVWRGEQLHLGGELVGFVPTGDLYGPGVGAQLFVRKPLGSP